MIVAPVVIIIIIVVIIFISIITAIVIVVLAQDGERRCAHQISEPGCLGQLVLQDVGAFIKGGPLMMMMMTMMMTD